MLELFNILQVLLGQQSGVLPLGWADGFDDADFLVLGIEESLKFLPFGLQ
jgi:hypothetical protein